MSSSCLLISDEVAVDGVAQPAFERPTCLRRGLGLAEFALIVLPPRTAGADLTNRDQMQGAVELTVPGPGKPVSALLAAGDLDRRGAAVYGEVVAGRGPPHRAGVPEGLRRQDGADAVD